jgi:hypothetical protein
MVTTRKGEGQQLSIAKMNRDDLKAYTDRIAKFTEGDGTIAIRICECCILIKD